MTKSEIESILAYMNANPNEWHSLVGTSVLHKCGEVGRLIEVDYQNGKPYLHFQFRKGPFHNSKPCFLPESFEKGILRFVSLPNTFTYEFQRSVYSAEDKEAVENAKERLSIILSNKDVPFPLPKRLQDFIAGEVGWNYRPKRNDYDLTDHVPVIDYMGTYFPRSFAEAYFLISLLLQKPLIAESLLDRSTISIADIGSGTGGNLLGVLWGIRDYCLVSGLNFPVVVVASVDKSAEALGIQSRLIGAFFPDRVTIEPELLCCQAGTEFIKNVNRRIYSNGPFNLIMCWKFVCEFYRSAANHEQNNGMYAKVLSLGERFLKEDGLLAICDVTLRPYPRQSSLSHLINRELHQFLLRRETSLVPILPLSCAHWHTRCSEAGCCFIQRHFSVRHEALPRGKGSDGQGVFMKVFARKAFAKAILQDEEAADEYVVGRTSRGVLTTCCFGRKGDDIPPEGHLALTGRSPADAFQWRASKRLI